MTKVVDQFYSNSIDQLQKGIHIKISFFQKHVEQKVFISSKIFSIPPHWYEIDNSKSGSFHPMFFLCYNGEKPKMLK